MNGSQHGIVREKVCVISRLRKFRSFSLRGFGFSLRSRFSLCLQFLRRRYRHGRLTATIAHHFLCSLELANQGILCFAQKAVKSLNFTTLVEKCETADAITFAFAASKWIIFVTPRIVWLASRSDLILTSR